MDEIKILVIGLSGESIFFLCDHFNEVGETIQAKNMFTEAGGKGFNQALTLGRIGANVSFITAFGKQDDYIKNKCLKLLKENNVKVYPIIKDYPSSVATIITDKNGENNVILYPGVSNEVKIEDILFYKDIILESDVVLLQLEFPLEVIKEVIEFSYFHNVKVVLNPAPAKKLDRNILKKVYLLTPNEFELLSITSQDVLSSLESLECERIVCTRGKKDILAKKNDEIFNVMVETTNAVDTTGAGDIFNAFLVYFIFKYDYKEAITLASIASTLSVKIKGVVNAIPSVDEVLKRRKN